MFSNNPKVKDLSAFLSGCDPEALVLISDGHEGVNQLDTTVGFIAVNPDGRSDGGYVISEADRDITAAYDPAMLWAPAVQLDSGT